MDFLIADTFRDSLARLTGDEQKAAKTTAFDLQMNPINPGMQLHKLDKARDPNFWSARVGSDIRLILHRTSKSMLLCYVDHHDAAYAWAQRRKLETHPRTGAAQLVEVRETVKEILIPKYVEEKRPAKRPKLLFADVSENELLGFGVPADWLDDVKLADEDSLLELADHLPKEAAEALLTLATGAKPKVAAAVPAGTDPFAHPDAQRRFRVMTNVEELERALNYPWEKWTVFLHPAQRELVERDCQGPTRVCGSAGTGKTIVALHRAVQLARKHKNDRVLLATFSATLAGALKQKLQRLVGNEPTIFDRIAVDTVDAVALQSYTDAFGAPALASDSDIREILSKAPRTPDTQKFSDRFLFLEWAEVVDAWQLNTWEAYRDVARLGRKMRLGEKQRQALWTMFEHVRSQLADRKLLTMPAVHAKVADRLHSSKAAPFLFAVIDECQDISIPQLVFLEALGHKRDDGLFFAGDLGQRIFQTPFSWASLGIDVRGRSHTLRINYRTSHQIRRQADRLLPKELSDVDHNVESRADTISVFNGPDPEIIRAKSPDAERDAIAKWLSARTADGVLPHEIGIFVRSDAEIKRARAAVKAAKLTSTELDDKFETVAGKVSLCTMHRAKGLEFRAVVVAACDDEIIPLQSRIESVVDDSDLEEVYNTERHLLYVACTRARDHLLLTGVSPASEFIEDMIE